MDWLAAVAFGSTPLLFVWWVYARTGMQFPPFFRLYFLSARIVTTITVCFGAAVYFYVPAQFANLVAEHFKVISSTVVAGVNTMSSILVVVSMAQQKAKGENQ